MRIFAAGWPKALAGANTEFWHTLKLWRSLGIDVAVMPTWRDRVDDWAERIEGIGCRIVLADPDHLIEVEGLPGSIVVAFCNVRFLEHAHVFQGIGCRVVWLNCMNFHFPQEKIHLISHAPFDRYVFQTEYQRDKLVPHLRTKGYTDAMGRVIRGAFDASEFPQRIKPHRPGERFIVGRLSRKGLDKFPADLWAQYGRIPHLTSARVMGWSADLDEMCGEPPKWAETIPECGETSHDFLASIHALVPGCGCTPENWPRVGLEAMSTGVPIVAEDTAGWREMLGTGGGSLVKNANHQAYEVARLAYDEQYRMGQIARGLWHLDIIASRKDIGNQWLSMFQELDSKNSDGATRGRTSALTA